MLGNLITLIMSTSLSKVLTLCYWCIVFVLSRWLGYYKTTSHKSSCLFLQRRYARLLFYFLFDALPEVIHMEFFRSLVFPGYCFVSTFHPMFVCLPINLFSRKHYRAATISIDLCYWLGRYTFIFARGNFACLRLRPYFSLQMKWLALCVLAVVFVTLAVADGEIWEEDDHEILIRSERGAKSRDERKFKFVYLYFCNALLHFYLWPIPTTGDYNSKYLRICLFRAEQHNYATNFVDAMECVYVQLGPSGNVWNIENANLCFITNWQLSVASNMFSRHLFRRQIFIKNKWKSYTSIIFVFGRLVRFS